LKTATYLRLSLLIPFVVWGICLLIFAITNIIPGSTSGPVINSVIILFLFYVFGIIGWLLPYLLLALILLILSFWVRAQTLVKIFALSPMIMAIFIMIFVIVMLADSRTPGTLSPDLTGNAGEFLGSPVWFGIVSLVWGYISVAIGFGIYRLLQALQVIRDAETPSAPVAAESA
jgi:hypothetical protein